MIEGFFRVSIITDDLERSISLYRDSLNLDMLPLHGEMAIFPMGPAVFEVCGRGRALEYLGATTGAKGAEGLIITVRVPSTSELSRAEEMAVHQGCTLLSREFLTSGQTAFRDFNGVTWVISITIGRPERKE